MHKRAILKVFNYLPFTLVIDNFCNRTKIWRLQKLGLEKQSPNVEIKIAAHHLELKVEIVSDFCNSLRKLFRLASQSTRVRFRAKNSKCWKSCCSRCCCWSPDLRPTRWCSASKATGCRAPACQPLHQPRTCNDYFLISNWARLGIKFWGWNGFKNIILGIVVSFFSPIFK